MRITLNKDKSIGKVLFVVEGPKTEPYLLWQLFARVFDYQVETITRDNPYRIYNKKDNPNSRVFVINAEESNIKFIAKDNKFLDMLFKTLIEDYDFDIDNTAIYYIFDRDPESNTDAEFIRSLLSVMTNSRDNENYYRQGILLLSYPSIESFTLSCFRENSFLIKQFSGKDFKRYLHENGINHSNINDCAVALATENFYKAICQITRAPMFDIDNFKETNISIFEYEENELLSNSENMYNCLSLLVVSLIDLGLIEILN